MHAAIEDAAILRTYAAIEDAAILRMYAAIEDAAILRTYATIEDNNRGYQECGCPSKMVRFIETSTDIV